MISKIRVIQDRRSVSRIIARLACQCSYGGVSHDATLINLSMKGAYLSSKSQPPKSTDVTITLKTSLLKKPLVLEGKILRMGFGVAEQGTQYRFGVRFNYSPLDLVELVNKLISQPANFSRF